MENIRKLTLIGGSGFVGTNLGVRLEQLGVDFEILDIKESQRFPAQYKPCDVRDLEQVTAAITGDVVINLAALHRDDVRDKSAYYETNVTGAKNICAACDQLGVTRIIFTSTVAVYGFAPPHTDETAPLNPFNDYGNSKQQAEEVFQHWADALSGEGRTLTIIRPTVIFGEGNRGNVYNLLKQIAGGRFVMVGDGRNVKSMAYIGNVVDFIWSCTSQSAPVSIYNYVDEPQLDMNALVTRVRKVLGKGDGVGPRLPYSVGIALGVLADGVSWLSKRRFPISAIRVKKFCAETSFSSKASQVEGFQARFTVLEGLENTLESEFLAPDPTREIFFTE